MAADPYWSNVVALLHFDGADGSTTITDEKGATWTRAGSAQIDTAQSKFGGSSLLLDGSNDYVTTPDSVNLEFGSGDFTIEGWIRPNALTGASFFPAIFGKQDSDASNCAYLLYLNQNNGGVAFQYTTNGTARSFASKSGALTLGQWHHVAVSRVGNSLWVFLDGVPGTAADMTGKTLYAGTAVGMIGRHGVSQSGNEFSGWIDELRVTKGVGRYSSAFTPPTEPFPHGNLEGSAALGFTPAATGWLGEPGWFGDNTAGAMGTPTADGRALASSYVLGEDATLTSMWVNFSASTTAGTNVKGLIFADSAGAPGALLATSAAAAIPAGGGWVEAAIAGELPAGTYWLGYVCDNFTAGSLSDDTPGTVNAVLANGTVDFASPGAWPGTDVSYEIRLNAYVEYLTAIVEDGAISGASSLSLSGSGSLAASGACAGTAATSFSPSATLRGVAGASASAALGLTASATGQAIVAIAGTASAAFAATAAATGVGAASGTASVVVTPTGTVTASGSLACTSSIALAASGGLSGSLPCSGATAVSLAAQGSIAGVASASGSASLGFSSELQSDPSVLRGSVVVTLAATGALQATVAISGTSTTAFSTAAAARGDASAAGSSVMALSPSATARGSAAMAGSTDMVFDPAATGNLIGVLDGAALLSAALIGELLGRAALQGSVNVAFAGSIRPDSPFLPTATTVERPDSWANGAAARMGSEATAVAQDRDTFAGVQRLGAGDTSAARDGGGVVTLERPSSTALTVNR